MSRLVLQIRTPAGLLYDRPVRRVLAEDLSGWFGLLPGRSDLVAALPAGLMVFEDEAGEGFVGLSGGILDLAAGRCRVMAGRASLTRDLDEIADEVARLTRSRKDRAALHRGLVHDLAREALRRLVQEPA